MIELEPGDRVERDPPIDGPRNSGTVEDVVPGHGFHIRWDDGARTLWSPSGAGLRRIEQASGERESRAA